MNNSSSITATSKPAVPKTYSYSKLQKKLLTIFLWGSAIAIVLVFVSIVGTPTPVIIDILLAAFLVLIGITFVPMPYVVRASILLTVLFGLAVIEGIRTGIFGNSRLFFLAFLLTAAMLFDRREFLITFGISVISVAITGWLLMTSTIILATPEVTVGYISTWIVGTLLMILLAWGVEEGWRQIQKEFLVSQSTLKNAMNALSNERANFETRFAERRKETESVAEALKEQRDFFHQAGEVLQTTNSIRDTQQLMDTFVQGIGERFHLYHVGIYLNDENNAYTMLHSVYGAQGANLLAGVTRVKVDRSSIIGNVAATGTLRTAKRVKDDVLYNPNPDLPETRSFAALPLLNGQQAIGVLDLESNVEGGFSDQDLETFAMLANRAAAAIVDIRTLGVTQQALTEARAVYGHYLRQAWEKIATEKRAVGYRYSASAINALETPLDLPEITTALESGQAVISPDQKSTMAIPLKLRDEVIGVLDIRSNDPGRQWTENELAVIQAVAERVSLALENARLFEETTRRADRERTVSEISTHIRSTSDPQAMLSLALDELKRALGAKDIRIRPYSPASTERSDQ